MSRFDLVRSDTRKGDKEVAHSGGSLFPAPAQPDCVALGTSPTPCRWRSSPKEARGRSAVGRGVGEMTEEPSCSPQGRPAYASPSTNGSQ